MLAVILLHFLCEMHELSYEAHISLLTLPLRFLAGVGFILHFASRHSTVCTTMQLVTSLEGKKVVQIGCGLQHTVALTA